MTYRSFLQEEESKANEKEAIWFLVSELSGYSRSELLLHGDDPIPNDRLESLKKAITQYRDKGIPVQYILGYTYFYGLKIKVNPHVLIPRYETEELVEKVIERMGKSVPHHIVDVGCGSGCIAIRLQKQWPDASVLAIDYSNEALVIAQENAYTHQTPIRFMHNDLLDGIEETFDCIVSNPPYIDPAEEVEDLVKKQEPHMALFSPDKGLYHTKKIIQQAKSRLKPGGFLALEIAYNKRKEIEEFAKSYFSEIICYQDLEQRDRIIIMR